VPPDYQPIFESTKLPQEVPIVENKPNCGESSQEEQVKQLREIAMLLKCLLLVCGLVLACMQLSRVGESCVLVINMYQLCIVIMEASTR
jgi:hypothetical protein